MKKLLLATIVSMLAVKAQANNIELTDCVRYKSMAEVVMTAKQQNVSKEEINTLTGGLVPSMIDSAYKFPIMNFPESKEQVTELFSNQYYSICLQIMETRNK